MRARLLVAAIGFVAACGGKSAPEPENGGGDPPPAAMTCDGMGDALASALTEDRGIDGAAEVKAVAIESCTGMLWSQATIDCMAAVANEEGTQACISTMEDDQAQEYVQTVANIGIEDEGWQ